ncbi:hypothetical protein [Streptomyces sp. NPDC001296]
MATDRRVEEVQRMLGRAHTQVDNSASLIKKLDSGQLRGVALGRGTQPRR